LADAQPQQRTALIVQALREVVDTDDHLDVDLGNAAVAAAALLVAARSGDDAGAAGESSTDLELPPVAQR